MTFINLLHTVCAADTTTPAICHSNIIRTNADTVTYKQCGFTYSHRIPNFFTDNYDHLMYEDGKLLKDMVYLKISKNG